MGTLFYAVFTWILRAVLILCIIWAALEFILFAFTDGANPFNWYSIVLTFVSFIGFWLSFLKFSQALGVENYDEYKKNRGPRVRSKFDSRLEELGDHLNHQLKGQPKKKADQ